MMVAQTTKVFQLRRISTDGITKMKSLSSFSGNARMPHRFIGQDQQQRCGHLQEDEIPAGNLQLCGKCVTSAHF